MRMQIASEGVQSGPRPDPFCETGVELGSSGQTMLHPTQFVESLEGLKHCCPQHAKPA